MGEAVRGRALVIGGGGVAGIAWLIGLMAGFADRGLNLLDADLILGTSAGASGGAQLTSGMDIETLFARQVDPVHQVNERDPPPGLIAKTIAMRPTLLAAGDDEAVRRARCAYALTVDTISEAERRAVIAARLPSHSWPAHPIKFVALDTANGEVRLFDAASGVDLVDAVAASSSVPGVWPATTIQGRRYTDGGVRSPENADLAVGYGRVLILSPIGENHPGPPPRDLRAEINTLHDAGAEVLLIQSDANSRAAMTDNRQDPATRAPTAHCGRAQGRETAAAVAAFWTKI